MATTCDLRVGGMDCVSCASAIETALRQLEGVEDVGVDIVSGRVRVRHAESEGARDQLAAAIRGVGYSVEESAARRPAPVAGAMDEADEEVRSVAAQRNRNPAAIRLVMAATSGATLAFALLLAPFGAPVEVVTGLLIVSSLAGGWYVIPRALRAARSAALDMNSLMSIAAGGAWAIGEPREAAATLFLFAVAQLLESHSMDRARRAIGALMELSPAVATVVSQRGERRIPAAEVVIGERVIVRPGEKIPVDGEVTDGRSSVNEAPITGESMPVEKQSGAEVFAGSLNLHGVLEVRSTKAASDTTLARIVHAVEEAQASRAPSQSIVDRFARVYTPAVVGIALFVALLPPLTGVGSWETWIYRALAMLVVACPCALVISTPVSIVSGLTGAARAGVLIKGGVHLENAARVTMIAFDKTGTLTRGLPSVTDVVALDGQPHDELLRLALGVERNSEHPLAQAIIAYGDRRGLGPPPSTDFESLPGRGARANVAGEHVFVGNERFAQDIGVASTMVNEAVRRFEAEGKTAVLVFTVDQPLGIIAISDQVRPEAAAALSDLRRAGIRRTLMLTGDNTGTARAVAESLGITEFQAHLLPDDKARIVRELEVAGERVAFVGDGVNDAPALASATVGIAMGAAGTDVALETADIALMADDLSKLAVAIRMSRKTLRVIKQNIWFSIGVKAVFLVLAVSGWATLWMAVAADMGASLVVVANGLRARRE